IVHLPIISEMLSRLSCHPAHRLMLVPLYPASRHSHTVHHHECCRVLLPSSPALRVLPAVRGLHGSPCDMHHPPRPRRPPVTAARQLPCLRRVASRPVYFSWAVFDALPHTARIHRRGSSAVVRTSP